MKKKYLSIICATILTNSLQASSFMDIVGDVVKTVQTTDVGGYSDKIKALSNGDVSTGLKETLTIGVKEAVKQLGKEDGFLNNPLVKIPLPKTLKKARDLTKSVGGEKYANDLVLSINRAASKATIKTAPIFIDAISNITIEDGKKILTSEDDSSATKYLQTATTASLKNLIQPIIKETMKENNVIGYLNIFTNYYDKLGVNNLLKNDTVNMLGGMLGVKEYLPSQKNTDIESYITNKSIEGIFKMIAEKEKDIRDKPIMRETQAIKKIFGAL